MNEIIKKASVLVEALPYIKNFRGKSFVIKYGGSTMEYEDVKGSVLEDVVFLSYVGIRTVIVHGGGPSITKRMKQSGRKAEFVDGFRVTDLATMKIVEEELEVINERLVGAIIRLGGGAVGLSGKEDGIIIAEKVAAGKDLGYVGRIKTTDAKPISDILHKGGIAVVSPVGLGPDKKPYNINGDEAAGAIASALPAEKLILLTDVDGILRHKDDKTSLISTLKRGEVESLISQKIIQGGMIPKVNAAISALSGGVKKTHIINGTLSHSILLEIFTDEGIGTEIIR